MSALKLALNYTIGILTLYILCIAVYSWFRKQKSCQYNIGCYVVNHSLNLTDSLRYRIQDLQQAQRLSLNLIAQNKLSIIDNSNFHNKSVQLALSFEKYIKKLTQQQNYNLQNVQILRQISKAQKQYLTCKKEIDQTYSEQDCSFNWNQYLNCNNKMQIIKKKLESLTDDEQKVQSRIADIIKMPNNSISPLDLAKRAYNQSMKSNEKHKNELLNQLTPLQNLLRKKIYERNQAIQKYQLTLKNYKQCQQNKKKHHACQEISKEVRNINSENIAYLKIMMQSKQQLLKNLQRILDSQKNSKQIEQLNEKYLKHKEEYIVMFKEFISLERENQKACGCTAQLESQLRKELSILQNKQITLNIEIKGLEDKINALNYNLDKCEQERQEIVRNYKIALQKNQKPVQSQTQLTRANRDLKKKYNQILDLKGVYKNIVKECDDIKLRMSLRVDNISKINECISKKNYYVELKKQTAQYIHSDNQQQKRMLESKRQLTYFLNSFANQ